MKIITGADYWIHFRQYWYLPNTDKFNLTFSIAHITLHIGWINSVVISLTSAKGVKHLLGILFICCGVVYSCRPIGKMWSQQPQRCVDVVWTLIPRSGSLEMLCPWNYFLAGDTLFCWRLPRQKRVYLNAGNLQNLQAKNIGLTNCCHTALLKKSTIQYGGP